MGGLTALHSRGSTGSSCTCGYRRRRLRADAAWQIGSHIPGAAIPDPLILLPLPARLQFKYDLLEDEGEQQHDRTV